MACIYFIKSINSDKIYIGSTINPSIRERQHFNKLRKGNHHSVKLQNYYNKYGDKSLKFEIFEEFIFPSDYSTELRCQYLESREQYYLDTLDPYFNICKFVGNTKGHIVSDIHKSKISLRNRNNNYAKGYKFDNIQLLKCSIAKRKMWDNKDFRAKIRKLSDYQIIDALDMKSKGFKTKDIALKFGISSSQMSRILNGRNMYSEFVTNIKPINSKISPNKLNRDSIKSIIEKLKLGLPQTLIAKEFEVNQSVISKIKTKNLI